MAAILAGLVATRYTGGAALDWYRRPATLALAFVVAYIGVSFTLTQVAVHAALDATLDASALGAGRCELVAGDPSVEGIDLGSSPVDPLRLQHAM